MKRTAKPDLSPVGEQALSVYEHWMCEREDLTPASMRNYLSDLRQFMAWYELTEVPREENHQPAFSPHSITTPTLTRYRAFLQQYEQKPASINRALISVKRYFHWALSHQLITINPAAPVKLVGEEPTPPRHLSDQEEQALVATVARQGTLRDRTIIQLLLHTGLRAREVCQLKPHQVTLGKRSGSLMVVGKRNKYRDVPLNTTARKLLEGYLPSLPAQAPFVFLSEKTHQALSERALGYIVKKYAYLARVADLSPHDLRHRFGYRMAETVPLHRLAQIMGHDSLDTTKLYVQGTIHDLQQAVETIAWI